jgi:hypothetical protein
MALIGDFAGLVGEREVVRYYLWGALLRAEGGCQLRAIARSKTLERSVHRFGLVPARKK